MSTEIATVPETKQGILLPISEQMIAKYREYLSLTVADIHDKKALKVVHDRRMELVKARTSIDKARKELNEDAKRKIDETNALCKSFVEQMTPIEEHLRAEEQRVEDALEAERVEVANKVYLARREKMDAVGYQMPEPAVRSMSDEAFEHTMVIAQAQAVERERLAAVAKEQEAERLRLEAERQAEFERQEAERIRQQEAEAERLREEAAKLAAEREAMEAERARQQAEEDARRKEESEKLERERQQFEEERRKAQEELDRQREEMAKAVREQEEKERQERLAREAEQAERDRIEAEKQRLAREAEEKRLEAERAEAERARLEAMKPDIQKLADYVAKLEKVKVPEVGDACQDLQGRVGQILLDACAEMRVVLGL